MIYLFHGTDKIKVRNMAHQAVKAAQKKHADAEYFKLNIDNFSVNKLDELIANQGLFYSGSIVLVDSLFDNEDFGENLIKKIKEISESPNFFVFLESELNKKELETFKKYADKVEEFVKPFKKLTEKEELAQKGEKISFFKFTDALGARDKKGLWALYQDALALAVPAEEIQGIFFWQVKSMFSAVKSKDATEAGLNPFVFSKAKNYASNYGLTIIESEKKLQEMSRTLFKMYHEAHRGNIDFHIALEKFILEL
jgi:DNA polymerase III delta subunit